LAKKQKKPAPRRLPTKHQLSKWQRQQRLQRIIVLVGAIFFAFIVGYVGYGYYDDEVKPLHQPVVRVNDTVLDMDYYIKVLDIYTQGQESDMVPAMVDEAVEAIEQNELIKQGVADLGIGVSAEEINAEFNNLNLPDNDVARDLITVKVLTDKLLEDYFDPQVPTACEQVQVQAMFLESEEVAEDVIDRLGSSDNFTSLAEEFSTEEMTKGMGGDLGWLPKGFLDIVGILEGSLLEDIAFNLEPGALSEPTYDGSVAKGIGYWLIEVIERDESQGSHTRGILLGSRQEAEAIRARLEAGEDFATLAREHSQHSDSKEAGGDFGWLRREAGSPAVVEIAFNLEPGVLSEPVRDETVQTQGGYWLVRVLDKDANRQLEDIAREMFKAAAFEDWLGEQKENSLIENYLDEKQKAWAAARVIKDRGS